MKGTGAWGAIAVLVNSIVVLVLALAVFLAGCAISEGVVKDVKVRVEEKQVVVTQKKCDLRLWFAFYVVIITGEGNCRTEVVAQ